MYRRFKAPATVLALLAALIPAAAVSAPGVKRHRDRRLVSHVLLISVDGLHESDLAWFVRAHPRSELARLATGGIDYTRAQTPIPSDSFPGIVALTTGGDPGVTGIYYDNAYDHALLPPGTTSCAGVPLGTPVNYDESDDRDPNALDAGQGLAGLPGSILKMTPRPQTLIVPADLPVDPKTCKPVYPHQDLEVNTVFDVVHKAGARTAWSDKNPGYDLLSGRSGRGIDDLFTPEIKSVALHPNGAPYGDGIDWTLDNAATMQYDSYKVRAVINEIDGYDHSRSHKVGVPAIFGMNFQTVSTAQKLPSSDGLRGGYLPGTTTPGPLLRRALDYINTEMTAMVHELRVRHLLPSTAIILTAKHGQSPEDPNTLTRVDDGAIINAINAAWTALHPSAPPLIATATDDTAIQLWLSDRSQQAAEFVKHYLLTHSVTGNTVSGGTRTLPSSGLTKVYAGAAAAAYFGVRRSDTRHPDVWGVTQPGVLYTGGKAKIADHGGAGAEDRDVALVLYAPHVVAAGVDDHSIEITRVAPTILKLLGFDPSDLDAVRLERTHPLPGT
jgi:hypothetical protein